MSRSVAAVWPGPVNAGILGPLACDARGTLYLRAVAPVGGLLDNAAPVVSVTAGGKLGPSFSPSQIRTLQGHLAVIGNFAVDQDGRVYFLLRTCPGATGTCHEEVARFLPDGQYEASTTLSGPDFSPEQLSVLQNGRLLVTGFAKNAANPLATYTAVYDSRGSIIATVPLPGDAKPPSMPAGPLGQGTGVSFIATDAHGNAYLVRPVIGATLFTINEQGTVVSHARIVPPIANGVPVAIRYAGGGRVLLQFAQRTPEGITASRYIFSLVDARNGHTIASYTADEDTGGLLGCYSSSSGIEFLSRQTGGATTIRFDALP